MATKGITIAKPDYMSDNEWHYFQLEYKNNRWSLSNQYHNAAIFHDGWESCVHDDTRRSIGEELPEK